MTRQAVPRRTLEIRAVRSPLRTCGLSGSRSRTVRTDSGSAGLASRAGRGAVRAVDSINGAESRVVAHVTFQDNKRGCARWVVRVLPPVGGRVPRPWGWRSVVPVRDGQGSGPRGDRRRGRSWVRTSLVRGALRFNALTCGFTESMLSWGAHFGSRNVNLADTFGLESQAVVDSSGSPGAMTTPQVSDMDLPPKTRPVSESTRTECATIGTREINPHLILGANGPKKSSCV